MKKIRAGIIGGAGYTGGETIRVLLNHPGVLLTTVHSRSHANEPLHSVHRDLMGETDLVFTDSFQLDCDVVFLCLGHGESKKFLQEHDVPAGTKVIDLGNDFRLGDSLDGRTFIYGLPELNKNEIQKASNIANPGCFATAIQLGLLPLAAEGLLGEIHTTGITGSTGAGQKLQDISHFSWRANNISAYKSLTHQHVAEINRSLQQLQSSYAPAMNFIPWRGDFTRGIFVSSVVNMNTSVEECYAIFKEFYSTHPFTSISETMVDLKQVVNTNKCLIHLEKEGDKLVIHSAIDNLVKGAAGQAVQNMNLMYGLDETEGLKLKSSAF
jgi:N-acetyl-gamma-glutamyl-phosphate reductase